MNTFYRIYVRSYNSYRTNRCKIFQLEGPAESARAVTGRWCPQSGEEEDFLTSQPVFFTKTAVTPERKVEKSFPRWEMNGLSEGYKRALEEKHCQRHNGPED